MHQYNSENIVKPKYIIYNAACSTPLIVLHLNSDILVISLKYSLLLMERYDYTWVY